MECTGYPAISWLNIRFLLETAQIPYWVWSHPNKRDYNNFIISEESPGLKYGVNHFHVVCWSCPHCHPVPQVTLQESFHGSKGEQSFLNQLSLMFFSVLDPIGFSPDPDSTPWKKTRIRTFDSSTFLKSRIIDFFKEEELGL